VADHSHAAERMLQTLRIRHTGASNGSPNRVAPGWRIHSTGIGARSSAASACRKIRRASRVWGRPDLLAVHRSSNSCSGRTFPHCPRGPLCALSEPFVLPRRSSRCRKSGPTRDQNRAGEKSTSPDTLMAVGSNPGPGSRLPAGRVPHPVDAQHRRRQAQLPQADEVSAGRTRGRPLAKRDVRQAL
jgi:hypothetical protein